METILEPSKETNGKVAFREPLISFVIPIYKNHPHTLRRCLRSLQDQDYANMEIICVLDGENDELAAIAAEYTKKVIAIEHSGACAARNAGFSLSTGDIISFFNSDYMAKPGMVRRWVDALLSHEDCGFTYGGYEYATVQKIEYPSKPFDPFLLDVANYIDCGFPLWRKYVVPWDVNCKSLQDWDFWLRVVKTHKVKGFYMGAESTFLAEPSGKPGGLSEDSHNNWIDRVHYIKSKLSIPEPKLVVTSLGATYHGKEIAKMIDADFRDDTLFKPSQYKALYMIGFYNRGEDMMAHAKVIAHFKDQKVKVILHFVGADIYWLRHRTFKDLKYLSGALKLQCDKILCENAQAHKELAEMGITSEILPIPPYNDYEVRPLPEKFSVGIFLTNKSDFDKYCLEETLSICRAMPDVQFMAYGDAADKSIQYENVKCVGNLSRDEWKQFVYDNSCYFRLVRHDTRPMASDEFILAGRNVVTNIPAPDMEYIDTRGTMELNQWDIFQEGLNPHHWPKTKKAIVQKIRAVRDGRIIPRDRQSVHNYYASMLDKPKFKEAIFDMAQIPKEER